MKIAINVPTAKWRQVRSSGRQAIRHALAVEGRQLRRQVRERLVARLRTSADALAKHP